jgi:type II restriction/modification system DNA methylase subunit YeeA
LLGLLCSGVSPIFLDLLNSSFHVQAGDLARIPWNQSSLSAVSDDVAIVVAQAVEIARNDWDNFETSWEFKDLPLLRKGTRGKTLAESWQSYSMYCTENIKKLQTLETENNRLFIEVYGLQDELKPDVPEDQITLARADATKDIKAFVSYAIGCMMGRYSLSKPGLQFAGGEWDDAKFKGAKFQPDPDGILPVLGDAFFEDDPTERLAEFLTVTFGKETLNDNLQFIAQTLGMKGNESPRDAIRRYLADGFFKDHLRTYKKRPIYWLFSSGKEQAFQALVYMHRYTPATLSRMRTAYLHELQNKLDARVDEIQQAISEATTTAHSNRLNKDLTRIKKQQAELLAFDEKLNNLAGKKIAIDLDDGVKHNYGLFGDLLSEVKTVCGKDEE